MKRWTMSALFSVSMLAPVAFAAPQAGVRAPASDVQLETLRSQSARLGDALKIHEGPYGMPRYLSGVLSGKQAAGVTAENQARSFLRGASTLFPVPSGELNLVQVNRDAAGGSHVIFTQSHRGVAVKDAQLVVHLDATGAVRAVNSSAVAGLNLNTRPTLSANDVYSKLNNMAENRLTDVQDAKLVIFPTRSRSYLTWQVSLTLDVGPRVIWMDAHTGKMVWVENPLRDSMVEGSGIDAQGQPVDSLNVYKGRAFRADVSPMFKPYIQGAGRGKYNLVDETNPDLGIIYTLTSNETYLMDIDWVNSKDDSFDDTSNHNHAAGVSAHTFYRQTLDFYKSEYNRNGIDDDALPISAVVEVNGIPGYPLECNAGWLGYGYNFMMFGMGGDCFDLQTYPFSASLDVIGHELNHGVNEFTINLGYNHEAGALNEHFADVFGILTEAANDAPDWLIGEDLFIDPPIEDLAFRSFSDPAGDNVLMAQPDEMDTYFSAPVSYDAGGVHFNSGIPNRAFYLAVEGGSLNGVTVPKLAADVNQGRAIAGQIWYDVMNNRRISNISQFIDLRDALIDATESLYPDKVNSIARAMEAVGIVDGLYPTAAQDKAEPNDYPGIAMPLVINATTSQYIWAQNDADIYTLDLNAGQTVQIDLTGLTFDAALGVYSVGLYDTLASEAASDNDGTFDEKITFSSPTGGTFYVEVIPMESTGSRTNKYNLTVTKQ